MTRDDRVRLAAERCYRVEWVHSFPYMERFFERLPLAVTNAHIQYAGMFARLMCELGRERELIFYQKCMERIFESKSSPEAGYLLCVFSSYLDDIYEQRLAYLSSILDAILRDSRALEYHFRSRILLANCSFKAKEIGLLKALIERTGEPSAPSDRLCLLIWKAIVLRIDHRLDDSNELLVSISRKAEGQNWYAHFYANLNYAMNLRDQGRFSEMRALAEQLLRVWDGRRFNLARQQVKEKLFGLQLCRMAA